MRYIKLFESFSTDGESKSLSEIDTICQKFGITNYTINSDGSVDVDGDVNLSYKGLIEIPLKFGKVSRGFYCQDNSLNGLEGAPREVGGDFICDGNRLTTLEGAPIEVSGNFFCGYNKLITLEGAPRLIGGNFDLFKVQCCKPNSY
jgi:hypothetical protein